MADEESVGTRMPRVKDFELSKASRLVCARGAAMETSPNDTWQAPAMALSHEMMRGQSEEEK